MRLILAVIEPRTGGRWYERGDDGAHVPGSVLAWERASRLVLLGDIADWQHDPALKTEIEIRFLPGTRIGEARFCFNLMRET